MNKLLSGALALSMVATMGMAESKMYIGVGTAMEMIESDMVDDMGMAIEFKIGTIFDNNFGVEGKVTKTISPAEDDSFFRDRRNINADMMTYSIFGTYHHRLSSDLIVSPKIGFLKEEIILSAQGFTDSKFDDSGMVFGVDIKKNISYNLDIYAGITHIEEDVNHVSFGLEKRF